MRCGPLKVRPFNCLLKDLDACVGGEKLYAGYHYEYTINIKESHPKNGPPEYGAYDYQATSRTKTRNFILE